MQLEISLKHPISPSPNDVDISTDDNEDGEIKDPSHRRKPRNKEVQKQRFKQRRRKKRAEQREVAQAAGTYSRPSARVLKEAIFLQIGLHDASVTPPLHDKTVYSLEHLLSVLKFRLVEWDGK